LSLKADLSARMKEAMKSGDKATLGYARNLHAAVRKKEIDTREDLDDSGVQKIVQTLAKQRRDSIDQFAKGGRDDLVASEKAELAFLETFLPAQLSDTELEEMVSVAIEESGAADPKDMGKVMGALVPKVQGRADGKRISQMVRQRLSGS